MKKKEYLPVFGIGPFYVCSIIVLSFVGIILSVKGLLDFGKIPILHIPFAIIGTVLIIFGLSLYLRAIIQSKLFDNIKSNTLVTTGVYSYVRNPIYSAFTIICTGALFIADNLCLLILPIVFWVYLTTLIKFTEEKWLTDLYGDEYLNYCKKVNRCIPWFRRK